MESKEVYTIVVITVIVIVLLLMIGVLIYCCCKTENQDQEQEKDEAVDSSITVPLQLGSDTNSSRSNNYNDRSKEKGRNDDVDSGEIRHVDSIMNEKTQTMERALSLGLVTPLKSTRSDIDDDFTKSNSFNFDDAFSLDDVVSDPYQQYAQEEDLQDWETMNNYMLMEEMKEVIQEKKLILSDDDETLEEHIFSALDINNNRVLQQRVRNNIFELKKQNGIPQIHQLPSQPYTLQFSAADSALEQEMKRSDSSTVNMPAPPPFYKDIKNMFLTEMGKLLIGYNDTKAQLNIECKNVDCNVSKCPCIKRICVFLNIYKEFYQQITSQRILPQMDDCFRFSKYNYTALCNDFQHIHTYHMLNNHEMQILICCQIREKYGCEHTSKTCNLATRRKKRRQRKTQSQNTLTFDERSLFPNKLDDIHSYFLHSTMAKGCHYLDIDDKDDKDIDDEQYEEKDDVTKEEEKYEEKDDGEYDEKDDEKEADNVYIPTTSKYDGRDDRIWIESMDHIDIMKEDKIYTTLVKNAGTFRWQGSTGFANNNRGALSHIKPKFANVKEEVLNNKYHSLSKEDWSQTVRKVTEFKKTFGVQRIRTQYDGRFNDHVLGHKASWKRGEIPSIKEIMVIKLYTDWDDLQFHLKKCFRIDSNDDIMRQYASNSLRGMNMNPDAMRKASSDPGNATTPHWQPSVLRRFKTSSPLISFTDRVTKKLEERNSEFYHWRGKLLIFINKFSTILEPTYYDKAQRKEVEWRLFHGINKKMILNASSTNSFYGPLSTTSSYYVAETFASDKGMILSIGSQYPRLKICNAFNASTLSDYPEEQEWLIGHIYLRIRKIYIKSIPLYVSMDSKLRFAFFAIHLFKQQVFSYNAALEDFILPFIQIHLLKVKQVDSTPYGEIEKSDDYKYLSKVIQWKNDKFHRDRIPTPPFVLPMAKPEKATKTRLFYILTKQFEQFCQIPNRLQIVKLDNISDGLKPYFLDFAKNENGRKWSVSFKKIINLFEAIRQIHFFNYYKLDDVVLQKLIKQINKKHNTLNQIKFIYYDYKDVLSQYPYFANPSKLSRDLRKQIETLNWKISYPKNENKKTGFCIKLKAM